MSPARQQRRAAARATAPAREYDFGEGRPLRLRWLCLGYFLLALLYFAIGFLPGRMLVGTDFVAAGYFFNEFVNSRFAAGSIPLWVPYVFGGLPHYSNPGGTYYPVRLILSLALAPDRALVALYVVQITVAGIATYGFLRALRVRWWAAALGGLAYEFTGVTLSFVYAGHDGRIIAATMLPVVLLCVTRALESGAGLWFVALSGAVATLLLSFQIQAAYYVLLAGAVWGLFMVVKTRGPATPRRVGLCVIAVALGFAVAAINFLPFAGYVAESPRATTTLRGYDFATSFSMPPGETVGLAVPEWHGVIDTYQGLSRFKYHTEYVGAFVLVLLVLGLRFARHDHRWRFFSGLGVFALVMAWGGYTPAYRLYYRLIPGLSRFRAPSIGFFLVSFSLVVMGAIALHYIAESRANGQQKAVTRVLALLALVGTYLLLSGVAGGTPRALGFVRFAGFLLLLLAVLWLWVRERIPERFALALLALLVVSDLALVGRKFMFLIDDPSLLMQPDDVAQFLIERKPSRVWVFPAPAGTGSGYLGNGTFGVNTDYLMHFGIRQMGGEHGNQLQRWNEYVGGTAQRMADFSNLSAHTSLVDAASVDYLVATVELVVVAGKENKDMQRLEQVFQNDRVLIYRNKHARPRAYFTPSVHLVPTRPAALQGVLTELWKPVDSTFVEVPPGQAPPVEVRGSDSGTVAIMKETPDYLELQTSNSRAAYLVLTETYAEGWQAAVDGKPVPIYATNYAFRGVSVPAGRHTVTFSFQPQALFAGVRVSLAALVALAIWLGLALRERRRASPTPDAATAV